MKLQMTKARKPVLAGIAVLLVACSTEPNGLRGFMQSGSLPSSGGESPAAPAPGTSNVVLDPAGSPAPATGLQEAFSEAEVRQDVVTKWLAYYGFRAIEGNDPRIFQDDGMLRVLLERALLVGLSAEDVKETIKRYPGLPLTGDRRPSVEAARISAENIKASLLAAPKIVESLSLSANDASVTLQLPRDQVAAFERLDALYAEAIAKQKKEAEAAAKLKAEKEAAEIAAKNAEIAAAKSKQEQERLQKEKEQLEQRIAAERVAAELEKQRLLAEQESLRQQAVAAAAEAERLRALQAQQDLLNRSQRLHQGSNGTTGWLLTTALDELAPFAAVHTLGKAPPCDAPGAVQLYRTSFSHPGKGHVWDHASLDEAYIRSAARPHGEGWNLDGKSFCVYSSPQAGTVPLDRYCSAKTAGRIYVLDGAPPPNDALGWTACGRSGHIYRD